MNSAIWMHYHPDERAFVERMADWIERLADQHQVQHTDFLDPRQTRILETLVRRHSNLQIRLDGGYPQAERKRAIVAPEYVVLQSEDAAIRLLSIYSIDSRISELDHGDYLGALLGLGLKRDKIGDLHVSKTGCQCLIVDGMADFIHLHLQQVHRIKVHTQIIPPDRLNPVVPQLEELNLTVASLRLDGIIGDICKLSRAKALIPIKAGRCKVNWKVEEDPSCLLKEGDTVSLKGFGRFVITAVQGATKKGRTRITVSKYV